MKNEETLKSVRRYIDLYTDILRLYNLTKPGSRNPGKYTYVGFDLTQESSVFNLNTIHPEMSIFKDLFDGMKADCEEFFLNKTLEEFCNKMSSLLSFYRSKIISLLKRDDIGLYRIGVKEITQREYMHAYVFADNQDYKGYKWLVENINGGIIIKISTSDFFEDREYKKIKIPYIYTDVMEALLDIKSRARIN